jgi:hypothetical protein
VESLKEEPNSKMVDKFSVGEIAVAFEKLFGGGRGVKRYAHSRLRYIPLDKETVLVEQNPNKSSEWAKLVSKGHRIAWVIQQGEYLARVIDGEVVILKGGSGQKI